MIRGAASEHAGSDDDDSGRSHGDESSSTERPRGVRRPWKILGALNPPPGLCVEKQIPISSAEDVFWVAEALELQSVAAEVRKEHGGLFGRLIGEADGGRNQKMDPGVFD